MARFIVIREDGKPRIKACVCCGRDDFFRHNETLFTCNHCGYTAEDTDKITDAIESVVLAGGA